MNNQMNLNNMMMNYQNSNNLMQPFNNNNNFNNIMPINNNPNNIQIFPKTGGILPRNLNKLNNDSFLNNTNGKILILFKSGNGTNVTINALTNMSVHDLLIEFAHKVGVGENALKKLVFLYSGNRITINESKNIIDYGLISSSVILVIDTSNLLGG